MHWDSRVIGSFWNLPTVQSSHSRAPLERSFHSTILFENSVYVLGGEVYDESSDKKVSLLDSFMMYSCKSGDFQSIGTAIYEDASDTVPLYKQEAIAENSKSNHAAAAANHSFSPTSPPIDILLDDPSTTHAAAAAISSRNNGLHSSSPPVRRREKFSFEIENTGKLPAISRHSMILVDSVNNTSWDDESQQFLYVIGGLIDAQKQIATNQMYAFNLKKQQWKRVPQKGHIPDARYNHSVSLIGNKLFLYGGTDSDKYFRDLLEFDLSSNTWFRTKTHGKSPGRRSGHSAVTYGTSIFIFGGGSDEKLYNDIYMLNTETLTWKEIKVNGTFIPTQRIHHTASVIGNRMLIFGGTGKVSPEASVLSFDFDENKWKKEEVDPKYQSPPPLIGHSSISCDSKMWIFGGYYSGRGDSKVNAAQLFSLETEVKGVCPITVPACGLQEDLSTLVGDSDVSDLIFELYDGKHFYAHKAILRVRSFFLYKSCIKVQHTEDMVDLQQLILHLENKRKKQQRSFPLSVDPNRDISQDVFEEVMDHVYTDKIPDFDEMPTEMLRDVCYLARIFRLDRLYKYGLPFMEQSLTSIVIPAPTLKKDMLRLYNIAMEQRKLLDAQLPDETVNSLGMDAPEDDSQLWRNTTSSKKDTTSSLDEDSQDTQHQVASSQNSPSLDVSEDECTGEISSFGDAVSSRRQTVTSNSTVATSTDRLAALSPTRHKHISQTLELHTTLSIYSNETQGSTDIPSYLGSDTSVGGSVSCANSFCDVLLKLDGESIPAHRCVLIARSDYFRQLLITQDPHEPYRKVVEMDSVDEIKSLRVKTLLLLLEFLYTGCVDIHFDVALELLIVSEHFGLARLSRMCQQVLERKIRVHNSCQFLLISKEYHLTHLKKSCSYFIVHHLSQVKKCKPYNAMPREVKHELNALRKQMKLEGEYDYEQESATFSPKHEKHRKNRHSKRRNNFKKSYFNNGKKPKKKKNRTKKRDKKVSPDVYEGF